MKTYIIFLIFLSFLFLNACSSIRSMGNRETYILTPSKCDSIGIVKRDDSCYQQVVIGTKQDAHVIITNPDGSTYDIDNSGQPSFAHDVSTAVQAIAIQKALKDD